MHDIESAHAWKALTNYLMLIVSTIIFCIFFIGDPQVAAEENDGRAKEIFSNKKEIIVKL
jgi:hypothetical protein